MVKAAVNRNAPAARVPRFNSLISDLCLSPLDFKRLQPNSRLGFNLAATGRLQGGSIKSDG
jgi:hypothetical protein